MEFKYSRMFHPMQVILSGSIGILGYYLISTKLPRCIESHVQAESLQLDLSHNRRVMHIRTIKVEGYQDCGETLELSTTLNPDEIAQLAW